MRFYITKENAEKVKTSFLNIRSFYLIDVQEISDSFKSIKNETYFNFFVSEDIKKKIFNAIDKKQYDNIIYINENLNVDIIDNIKDVIKQFSFIEKIVFIDDNTTHQHIYPLFDEIIFFPEIKRSRIIECKCIKNPLYYWINNCTIPKELL